MELEDTIMRLGDAPVHPGLAGLDGALLAQTARQRANDMRRPVVLASLMALAIGVAGAGQPTEPAAARNTLAPFGAASPLSPSTLIGETP